MVAVRRIGRPDGCGHADFAPGAEYRCEYASAYRRDLNSHVDGVTVVAILKLLDHLSIATGHEAVSTGITDIFDIIPAVRFAASVALDAGDFIAAAHSTLGELYLVSGDQTDVKEREEALARYRFASGFPEERDILAARLHFFAGLGFRPTLVADASSALHGHSE